jgi:hypothetical protein
MRVKVVTYYHPLAKQWSAAKTWLDDSNSRAWLTEFLPFPCTEGQDVNVDSEVDLTSYRSYEALAQLALDSKAFLVVGAPVASE